jgi:hypothetical protein
MTDHDDARHDPEPSDGPADGPELERELDDTTLAALRALLRDEPVDDDDLARERRIRTALDAATPPAAAAPSGPAPARDPAPAPGVVPAPRRRNSSGPWLVAAAVLLVLGVGGYLFVGLDGSGGNDEAAVTADRATGSTPMAAGDANDGTDGAESSAIAGSGPVVDLGAFEDLPALLAAADGSEARSDAAAEPTLPVGGVDPTPCVEEQRAAGLPVVATATLQGTVVVVVADPAGTRVLVAESCTDWPG